MERILAALGVKDEAEALQSIAVFNGLLASLKETTGAAALPEILPAVKANAKLGAELEQLTGVKGPAALGAISGFKAEAEKVPGLKAQVAALETQTTAHTAEKRTAKVKAMLDEAQDKGLVTPAEAPSLQAAGEKDDAGVTWLEGNLAVRSPVVATGSTKVEPAAKTGVNAAAQLSAAELKACKATGVTPEEFLAEKELQAKEQAERTPAED